MITIHKQIGQKAIEDILAAHGVEGAEALIHDLASIRGAEIRLKAHHAIFGEAELIIIDKGSLIPGYANGNAFEAYTTWVRAKWWGGSAEAYISLDLNKAERTKSSIPHQRDELLSAWLVENKITDWESYEAAIGTPH